MTKSSACVLPAVYAALFSDAKAAFPELTGELDRDLTRLQILIASRGLAGLAIDLPKAGKHFDQCLSRGQYAPSRLPFTGLVSKRIRIPKFLRGMILLVFDENGLLRKERNYVAIQFIRQVYYLAKKLDAACPPEAIRREIAEFLEVDCSLPEPHRFWDDQDGHGDVPSLSFEEILRQTEAGRSLLVRLPSLGTCLDKVFARIASTLGPYDPRDWRFKHGPGAISATTTKANKYEWYSWPERLEKVFPMADYGYYSFTSWANAVRDAGVSPCHLGDEAEEPSRLIAVPKTLDKPRLIAAEPSSHQWCQQNMWHYFDERVRTSWIGKYLQFRSQERNQRMCIEGSLTGHLATLDLSAASDRVTPDVVLAAFQRNHGLVRALRACRTRFVRVEYDDVVFAHKLKKFSTMGSACTFPVESLIFLGICLATCCAVDPQVKCDSLADCVSVFGDDIIVPTSRREDVAACLSALAFKVNESKSFSEGNFRESCGVDSMDGVIVTPVYLRKGRIVGPESLVSTVEAANHFYQRWMLHASDVLRRTSGDSFPLVHPDSGILGYHCRTGSNAAFLRTRHNPDLQRQESCVLTPCSRVSKAQTTENDSPLFQYFTENPGPLTKWTNGWVVSTSLILKKSWVETEALQGPMCQ